MRSASVAIRIYRSDSSHVPRKHVVAPTAACWSDRRAWMLRARLWSQKWHRG